MSAIATQDTGIQTTQRGMVSDTGPFANLLDTGKFNHLWRVSQLFADTALVPECFRGKPSDCFVAIQMALRLEIDPLMVLQNTYIVHGKPGIEAKLAIALINSSGLFDSSLQYEVDGNDPTAPAYRVRAFATRRGSSDPTYGPWVDWKMVNAEGWKSKSGSKWQTMPALMFMYRAATFFGRFHCPERLMGMQTADEIHDIADEPATKRLPPSKVKVSDSPSKPVAQTADEMNQALVEESAQSTADTNVVDQPDTAQEKSAGVENEAITIQELVDSLGPWADAQTTIRREFVKRGGKAPDFLRIATKRIGLVPEKESPIKYARLLQVIQSNAIDLKTGDDLHAS